LGSFAGFFSAAGFDAFAGPVDFAAGLAGLTDLLTLAFADGFDAGFAGLVGAFDLDAGFAATLALAVGLATGLAATLALAVDLATGLVVVFPLAGLVEAFAVDFAVGLAGFATGLAADFFAVGLETVFWVELFAAGLATLLAGLFAADFGALLAEVFAADLLALTGLGAVFEADFATGGFEVEDFACFAVGFTAGLAAGLALLAEGVMILLSVGAFDSVLAFDLEKPKEPRKPRFFESSCCFAIGASCRPCLNQ
jgi:hypothetical protein